MTASFFHISDLHIGQNPMRTLRAERLLRSLESLADKDEPIICTGDQVHTGGSLWQQDIVNHLMPISRYVTCPGNHDVSWYGVVKNRKTVSSYRRQVWSKNLVIYKLDSMDGVNGLNSIGADGKLGKRQLMDLDGWLSLPKNEGQVDVVILHHHPFFGGPFMRLADSEPLKEILKGRVTALLFGHRHYEERLHKKEDKWQIPLIYSADSASELGACGFLYGTYFQVDSSGYVAMKRIRVDPTAKETKK